LKKILALLAAAALVFAGTTPAKADVTTVPAEGEFSAWDPAQYQGTTSLEVVGSPVEGGTYTVKSQLQCPSTVQFRGDQGSLVFRDRAIIADAKPGGAWLATGGYYYGPSDPGVELNHVQQAGALGTTRYFASLQLCHYAFFDRSVGLTFVSPILKVVTCAAICSPSNFSVFPQSAGIAFTTWGVAAGATSYRVTATPTNSSLNLPVRTCTTAQNSCDVSGLTSGASYTFSLVATNGVASSTAVTSGPVSISPPVSVAAALNSTSWKVGSTVTAILSLQGSPSPAATITWYRCATPANPTNAQPVACDSITSGTATSYTLAAGDVGKYIAAFVFASNGSSTAAQTAASSTAVLAADAVAPAPVADPDGKPTVVNIPNPIVSVAGGTEVTITGTGLAGVTGVTVGGLPAIVVSKTDTTVVVQVPVSTKVGLADLTITNDKGSVTSKSAIIYALNPVIKITKTRTITGFKAGQKVLTAAQKTAVKSLISANPTLTTLSCAAKTTGVASNKTELAKAKTLATATCAYAKTLKKTLIVSSTASQTLPKSKASRSVALTFKN